jgi:SAM-dependent methyltransferase
MPRISFLPTILRETLGARTLPREPEPNLVMDGDDQVATYAEAGRVDGTMAASYLFHSAHVSEVIHGCGKVVDLGCGPATQLGQIAQFNPETEFHGIDLSAPMLEKARAYVAQLGLRNVTFSRADISRLDFLPDRWADGVISTMTLHHLPTREHLSRCSERSDGCSRRAVPCTSRTSAG